MTIGKHKKKKLRKQHTWVIGDPTVFSDSKTPFHSHEMPSQVEMSLKDKRL